MDGRRQRVRPSTAENYASIARTHIIPAIGKRRLTRLSPEDVVELLRRKHDAELSPNTVRLIRAVLRRALRHAERQDKVPRNVAALVDGVRVPKPQKRALNLDEAQRLLTAAREDRLGALYATLLELGLRLGEALGLRWDDVDLEHGNVTVVRRLDRTGASAETKTHGSRRTLHLSTGLIATLQAHAARQGEEMLRAGDLWHETGFVFTSEVGTPLDQSNLRRRFARCARWPASGSSRRTSCGTRLPRCSSPRACRRFPVDLRGVIVPANIDVPRSTGA